MADDQLQASSAAQWPDASLWPDDDAPPIEWARFYRDCMGWIVLPTASPRDVFAYAISLHNEAVADYALDHGGRLDRDLVPDEVSLGLWEHAHEIADATLGRPIGYIYKKWMAKVVSSTEITDDMLRDAWEPVEGSRSPREEADTRGIAVIPNRSALGLPVCLVDVDVGHDDSPAGDVDGPWGWQLVGPKASTPRGGLHTLMLATGKETAAACLGPGIDVVASGTPIPLPAGSATPGRRWLRKDAPVVAPDELRKRGRRKAPPRAGANGNVPGGDLEGEEGQGARVLSEPTGNGTRNRDASVLVGVLARPFACPPDFVRAALEMLAEHIACIDRSSDESKAEMGRWLHLLTRGPRDEHFAAEVMETWLAVRGDGTRMKTTPARFCASVWRVCDRREGGDAGAEDLGVGPRLGVAAAEMGDASTRIVEVPPAERIDHSAPTGTTDPPPFPPPTLEQAAAAVEASKVVSATWRGGIDPRSYVRTLNALYTDDDLRRDLEREPIGISAVMPAFDFVSGQPMTTKGESLAAPLAHGWGEHLGRALRGLAAGDFRVVGAAGAGMGKTGFLSWLVHGLGLATACRIRGMEGFAAAPVILPIWLTEMPKPGEIYLRAVSAHLGFDPACIADGRQAHEAPGVRAHARRLGWTPQEVVAHARMLERLHGADERFPLCISRRHVTHAMALSDLPRLSKRSGVTVDHRNGPDLIDHLADAVQVFREDLGKAASVPTDQVLPLIVVDPGQRFAGGGDSEKRAIDALFSAIVQVLCGELGCVVLGTSDTTKAAAREVNVDTFLGKDDAALAADIFAGSQAIMHHADVIAVCRERPPRRDDLPPEEREKMRDDVCRQWVRVLKNRSGMPPVAYPFEWDMSCGRFRALDPEPLRDQQQGQQQGQQQRASTSYPAADHMAGFPEIGTVLVTIPYCDDGSRLALKSVGATFDRGAKAWAVEASRARSTVAAARLPWKRPPPLAVAQVLPPPKLSGAERYVDD